MILTTIKKAVVFRQLFLCASINGKISVGYAGAATFSSDLIIRIKYFFASDTICGSVM